MSEPPFRYSSSALMSIGSLTIAHWVRLPGPMLAQRRTQLAHRVTQPALCRLHRHARDCADFLERQAALLVQHEHVALLRRQLRERAAKIAAHLLLGQRCVGPLVLRRADLLGQVIYVLRGVLVRPAAAAEIVNRTVVSNAEQEGVELRPRL